ncbi:MAG: Uma2 family endonuclease [Candidatus Accumulibacter sp.]|uniref:Uma2 family endonuclease n=1 Tax=Candidatus Accumulibacter cognatus TaxID=2954383 RepID=A0A7D5NFK2_9PROT|nr:Uma2 family endonuclease [Accumulibacter sp.]MCC2869112.1 Uma2 family endonuclease [Candidatus Accumulibacter phosphatis]QLH52111.1 MAG: Uma2 family endonuclease [Candidatus Accumulibacter cognatus]MBL8399957.1 Uma2 family endonuclease [Accumulibacter sp.]MBN8519130.1 Uma2 family endonuclease [Accumulibacter sp.]MBO3710839.1 Uma2 family endonuclease [Accumulibacter sp.]
MSLSPILLQASELGIRLEIVNGLPIWEAQPVYRHQKHIERIVHGITNNDQIKSGCACIHAVDVYIQFPNGLKRPDISIFCREPSEEEQDSALTMIPEAVIEVVSKGFEAKDLEIGPPFYLSQGVKDVIVFDPLTLLVLHVRKYHTTRQVSPVVMELECGCQVLV